MLIWHKIKKWYFVGRHVSVGERFHLGLFSWIWAPRRLTIGNDVYIGKFCSIQCNGFIGDGVLIANNVGIVGRRDHDFKQVGTIMREARWVGSDPDLKDDPRNSIRIESDVWIGYGCVVLSGVTIGKGSVIAAGSVVRSDVAPYSIVMGNPAVSVARRFSATEIEQHEKSLLMRQ